MGHAVFQSPALWGCAGAFIFAANELYACLFQNAETKGHTGQCVFRFFLSLGVGAVGAAAFAQAAQSWVGHDINAVSAVIGMLINPVAPRFVELTSAALSGVLRSKLVKLIKGDDPK